MNTTTEPLVLRHDRADGLTTLTLNRPGQFNSLSKDMLSALQGELDSIAASEAVRVVVIAGAGKAFCAGHDLKEMRGNHSKEFMQAQNAIIPCVRAVAGRNSAYPTPTIGKALDALSNKLCRRSPYRHGAGLSDRRLRNESHRRGIWCALRDGEQGG